MHLPSLALIQQTLLEPAGLATADLDRVIQRLLGPGIDTADIYLQATRYESWGLEDGIVKEGSHSIDQGAGIRAVSGEKTGFAYSDDITFPALLEAAKSARAITRTGAEGRLPVATPPRPPALYLPIDPHGDVRPLVRLNVSVIVEDRGRREQGSYGGGGRTDYRYFLEGDRASEYAREAVRQALVNLEAEEAPAGGMTVVLGSGWPGILLHEAIGHGLEGDFNRKGTSAFSGRVGEKVASPLCTVVDDGTLPGRRGSLTIDDEGTPTACTTLIENGILKGYMQDKLNARLMGVAPTGNGRRESYQHLPMPRMTNTYMLAGPHDPEEIIRSVKKGLYAKNFGGGQVDITSGKFVFSASEAYLIEDGRITRPVKGATLIGNGPDVLTRVSMVGNDLELDTGVGTCGKDGQSVPVGVGQPTLKVDGLTVGGTRVSSST